MLANDARILIRSAVATAIAGVILIVVGALVDGSKGALGAAYAVLLVAVFFTLSVVAVSLVGRWNPAAMTATALGTYVVKILAVAIIVVSVRNTTAFNTKLFGFTAIICILVWSAGQIAALARRIPYVEPDTALEVDDVPGVPLGGGEFAARQEGAALEASPGGAAQEAREGDDAQEARKTGRHG